ncbi:DUF6090 family protein [Maribacter sp. ACAM166]|uniref:DUF6090 family protein n=1 Tax=Maribacter sp. ACAM166 TaxID=2508996 RepID=UPI0010FD5F51|nr:DUF6090 family protein [Maribacter sp. ACAM166]TLP75658.1 hypothetical protein ES765_15100 [Maribacter sp. ACAM166]
MIKFFRKIRQNLLSENKFSKYLIYAIGEIILVVIGILIALSINNWNQNRINTDKQQDYLIGLKNDLEKQITSFNSSFQFYELIIGKGESVLVDFSSIGKLTEIDNINSKLSFLMYTRGYPKITTTFNELNSTGQLNLIKEKSLRSQVIKYYQNSEDNQKAVEGNTENVIYNQIFPIIKSNIIIRPENFGFENSTISLMEKLKSTFENNLNDSNKEFELINAISLRIIVAKTNKYTIENSKNEAELLLDRINNELMKINP